MKRHTVLSRRESAQLWLSVGITLTLSLYRISMYLMEPLGRVLRPYTELPLAEWLSNAMFFWLLALLWLAYRRWRYALEREEQLERIIAGISPDTLLVVNADRMIRVCNPAVERMFGYPPDEVINRKTDLLYEDRRVKGERSEIYDHLERIGFHFGTATGKRKDGSRFPVEIITGNLWEHRGAVILIRDMTERQRAEDERRQLERQIQQSQKLDSLGLLAGGIAHDFNNLLTGVLGNADLALMEMSEGAPGRERVQDIQNAAIRAAELCSQLLQYAGKGSLSVSTFSLSALVEEMSHLMSVSISKSAMLRCDLPADLPVIRGDATQMRQVVMNLITNASDAMNGRVGAIRVATGCVDCDRSRLERAHLGADLPAGTYVFLEVSDTGCGMDEQAKARMFDPFFSSKAPGRGLGLATVLGILRAHRGAVEVESEIGRGTTIRALLPAAEEEACPGGAGAEEPHATWTGEGTVLVVDDEERVRAVAEMMLKRIGYDVITAANGPEAVRVFEQHGAAIRIVLLDVTMPGMDGIETLRALRKLDDHVPVLMCSGYSGERVREQMEAGHANGFVKKPYKMEDLRRALKTVATG